MVPKTYPMPKGVTRYYRSRVTILSVMAICEYVFVEPSKNYFFLPIKTKVIPAIKHKPPKIGGK